MPKSISLARGSPSSVTRTFWGLMSRWTTARECAWSSASQRSAPISPISRSLSSPSRLRPGQGRAVDQLGDEQRVAVLLAHLVERDDAGVVEARRGLRLAQHPPAGLAARLDRLDRDRPLQPAVPSLVDDAEPAAADSALDQEAVEHERADQSSFTFAAAAALLRARTGKNATFAAGLDATTTSTFILPAQPTSLESVLGGFRQHPGRGAGRGRHAAPSGNRSCCGAAWRSAPG